MKLPTPNKVAGYGETIWWNPYEASALDAWQSVGVVFIIIHNTKTANFLVHKKVHDKYWMQIINEK